MFEDRATLAIVNRLLPVPQFTSVNQNGVLVITTQAVQLKYTVGKAFDSQSLVVVGLDPNSAFEQWNAGETNSGTRNLLGMEPTRHKLNNRDSLRDQTSHPHPSLSL